MQLPDEESLLDNTTFDVPSTKQPSPTFVVLYIVMRHSDKPSLKFTSKVHRKDEVIQVIKTMASVLSNEQLPETIKSRILIQVGAVSLCFCIP